MSGSAGQIFGSARPLAVAGALRRTTPDDIGVAGHVVDRDGTPASFDGALTRIPARGAPSPARHRVDVLGAPIDAIDMDSLVGKLIAWGEDGLGAGKVVCACNVHSVVHARGDAMHAAAIVEADIAFADGAPVAWLMRRQGANAQRRVAGPDLMWNHFAAAQAYRQSVFLLGATAETLERLCDRVQAAFPELVIAGRHAPPYRATTLAEDAEIVRLINESGASTVWVALGCPKQEAWITAHRGRVRATMIGVGAAFDFHSGNLRRAPRWAQKMGLEWLHRLASEPRRLWRRYLVTNSVFVALAAMRVLRLA